VLSAIRASMLITNNITFMAKFYGNCSANCMLTAADFPRELPKNLTIIDPAKYGAGFVILGIAIKLAKSYPNQKIILAYVTSDLAVQKYGLDQWVIGSDQEFDMTPLGCGNLLYKKIILDSNNKIWNKLWNN